MTGNSNSTSREKTLVFFFFPSVFDDLVIEKVEDFLDRKDANQEAVTVFIDGELGEKWLEYGVEIDGEEQTVES